jgi:peptidoglycan/LPS O-acetylase OafA/YrhL
MLFTASGFLITSVSIKRYKDLGKMKLLEFYLFRQARLLPCLLLVLAFVCLFNAMHISIFESDDNSPSLFVTLVSILTFWHNILMVSGGWYNYCLNILWSLSVTEVFYLTFPIICLTLKKPKWIIIFLIPLIIISPFYRTIHADNDILAMCANLSCLDSLGIGCCTAMLYERLQLHGLFGLSLKITAILTIAFLYFATYIMTYIGIGVTLVSCSTAILLLSANINLHLIPMQLNRIICWFGRNCYEIYLFHILVLAFIKTYIDPSQSQLAAVSYLCLFLILTALVAGFIAKFYSQALNNKLRNTALYLK